MTMVETFDGAENSGNQNYKKLVAFSLGKTTVAPTLERLGTDSAEDLFLLMAQAHLPMPRLPERAILSMGHSLHQFSTAKRTTKQAKLKATAPDDKCV
jgi:hypothetical protein